MLEEGDGVFGDGDAVSEEGDGVFGGVPYKYGYLVMICYLVQNEEHTLTFRRRTKRWSFFLGLGSCAKARWCKTADRRRRSLSQAHTPEQEAAQSAEGERRTGHKWNLSSKRGDHCRAKVMIKPSSSFSRLPWSLLKFPLHSNVKPCFFISLTQYRPSAALHAQMT